MGKQGTCDNWDFIGEDTAGYVFICTKCGAIKDETSKILSGPVSAVDTEILHCPEQGYVP